MRTEDVLESIDHALEDWTVSGDAMRWTPEKAAPLSVTPIRPVDFHVHVDLRPFVEAVNRATREMGELFVAVSAAVRNAQGLTPIMNREDAVAVGEEGVKARALALRRTRHTGPSTDIVHQKRPRKHLP